MIPWSTVARADIAAPGPPQRGLVPHDLPPPEAPPLAAPAWALPAGALALAVVLVGVLAVSRAFRRRGKATVRAA